MWTVAFFYLSYIKPQVMSHETKVECREFDDFPPSSDTSPSFLADLQVEHVTVGGTPILNISWAVEIDASIRYLTGTLIKITGESSYLCEYHPHLSKDVTGSIKKWFHYLLNASDGEILIQATNLPLPPLGSDSSYKYMAISILRPAEHIVPVGTTALPLKTERVAVTILGGLACLIILSACFIIYKCCGINISTSLGFRSLPQSPMVPTSVLMVYPAENSAFQEAVLALAEFLQWHGGCHVVIDMWQQGKIAEMGPVRWLAEQTKTADQVLIVCPLPFLQPIHSLPNCNFPISSVTAAAYDLYPLILNMVASHAKSKSDLAKFLVVVLGDPKGEKPTNVVLELRACKAFCLIKDLNQLCRTLHSQRQDNVQISQMNNRLQISNKEKYAVKLREAVEKYIQRSAATEKSCHLCFNIHNEDA